MDDRAALAGIAYQLHTGIPGGCCPLASLNMDLAASRRRLLTVTGVAGIGYALS